MTSKTAIRTYGLAEGRWFYFVIMDDSGSVRVKAFDNNCDRVFASISVGSVSVCFTAATLHSSWSFEFKMVQLSAYGVSICNKHYSQLNGDYELTIRNETRLIVLREKPVVLMRPCFKFRAVMEFQSLPVDGLYGRFLFLCA